MPPRASSPSSAPPQPARQRCRSAGSRPGRSGLSGRGSMPLRRESASRASRSDPGRLWPPRDARDVTLSAEVHKDVALTNTRPWFRPPIGSQDSRCVGFPRHAVEDPRCRLSPCHGKVKVDRASETPEEAWSSARLRDERTVPVTPPAPLPALPAVSATATACPGRGRDGRVPFVSLPSGLRSLFVTHSGTSDDRSDPSSEVTDT
jgi:hypothetical protein